MSRVQVQYTLPTSKKGVIRWIDPDTGILYRKELGEERARHRAAEIVPQAEGQLRKWAAGYWVVQEVQEPSALLTADPTPSPAPEGDLAQAFKSDGGKPRFDLLDDGCPNALLAVTKVLTWAVDTKGYHPHSWREVPEASRRYRAALARHRNAIARGEVLDEESGLPHWAHAACCTLFLLELENFNE